MALLICIMPFILIYGYNKSMKKVLWICYFVSQFLFAGSYEGLLFHGNCIACHDITASKSAPSIVQIQQVYKNAFRTEKAFVEYMSTWVYQPNEEGSLMHQAVKKYGLMPQLAYDKKVLEQIATYLYRTKFTHK